jgi:N utilization substance protein B
MSLPRKKKKAAGDAPKPRTVSRMAAVQALYQMDLAGTDAGEVIEQFMAAQPELPVEGAVEGDVEADETMISLDGGDATFFAEVVKGVVRRQREIDPLVDQQLRTGWRLVRVDSILRAILRAGVFELLERSDVPARVSINEYINIAKAFFEGEEPKVVNGVLDRIAHKVRAKEFEAPGEGG